MFKLKVVTFFSATAREQKRVATSSVPEPLGSVIITSPGSRSKIINFGSGSESSQSLLLDWHKTSFLQIYLQVCNSTNSHTKLEESIKLKISTQLYSNHCFGSGSRSLSIRIETNALNPDLFWDYGSGTRTVKMASIRKKFRDFKLKRALTFQ